MKNKIYNSIKKNTSKMPLLFIGHGSPMNGIEENKFTEGWITITKDIPTPTAILIISAHWETHGTQIYVGEKPAMIYDMYGFPPNLYQVDYPAMGSPHLAHEVVNNVNYTPIVPTLEWGLDHGAWSVLNKMYPEASIPCFQMSLNKTRDLQWHYTMAKELSFLRERGVLIIGSGNIVHNLSYMSHFNEPAAGWALEFDDYVKNKIDDFDHQSLINYKNAGTAGLISVNSAEHYIPLLYTIAMQNENEPITYFNHDAGSTLMDVFMRCVKIG